MKKLKTFSFNGKLLKTIFKERSEVIPGVVCDVYFHPETSKQDLGIITIDPGAKTPLQKVLYGKKTVEGYIAGEGSLTIVHDDGNISTFKVSSKTKNFYYEVQVGESMQWKAAYDSKLQVFEICLPPYEEGRFRNLVE